ncbi:MAG: hypothetical protein KF709_04120 [Gemmatimonadaceae bacterium]|nr:hypothetical protein [Gemmatimonadaceae bacterium]
MIDWSGLWSRRAPWVAAALVVLAALVASVSSLGNGFALDDVLVIERRNLLHSLSNIPALLTTAYWQLPPEDTLWRPLGLLSFATQWVAGDGAPLLFHAVSVLLYVAVCLVVLALAWQLLPAAGALAAALVFAVHPVHVESVGNIVGQLELWVALAVVGAAAVYTRARRTDRLHAPTVLAVLALALLGLGMKEHAVLLVGVLLALELTVLRDAPPARDGGMRARILFVALASITLLWLLVRSDIVGGLAGDRAHVALKDLGLTQRAWLMLGLVPELARLFVWPARLYADYSPQYTALHTAPGLAHLPGLLILGAFMGLLGWSWRRDHALALALAWIAVTYSIVANIVVPTGILLAERTLFLSTVGIALAAGALWLRLWGWLQARPGSVRTLVIASAVAVLGVAAAHSAERQHAWKDNDTMVAALVTEAPMNFRGHFWLGDELLRREEFVAGETAMRRAMALWPEHDGPPLGLALRLQARGLCEPALHFYGIARRLEPRKPTPHFGASGCLIAMQRFREARAVALQGLETGRSADAFRFLIYVADSSLAASDSAGPNWWLARRRRTGARVP